MEKKIETNPYYYKLYPGYWKEAFTPTYLELLRQMTRLLEKERMLSEEDRERVQNIEEKLERLIQGGHVGTPRRKP